MTRMSVSADALDALERLLPQTQCTQCGYAGCRPYAQAMLHDEAPINRCPPGGAAGIAVLAAHLGRPVLPLDPQVGTERPRRVARIVAELAGASRRLHAVITEACTGCDLCLPPCPVDCIEMVAPPPALQGWSRADADAAYARHQRRTSRLQREAIAQQQRLATRAQHHLDELDAAQPADADGTTGARPTATGAVDPAIARKRAVIEAAMARARARLSGSLPDTPREPP